MTRAFGTAPACANSFSRLLAFWAVSITRTFVWTEPHTTTVIGYYPLMAHVLQRAALPKARRFVFDVATGKLDEVG